ncbi:hypothetical protein RFI_14475, partial [Reticulomyxa filosa]
MSSHYDEKNSQETQKKAKSAEKPKSTVVPEVNPAVEKASTVEKKSEGKITATASVTSTTVDIDKEEKSSQPPLYSLDSFDNPRRFIRGNDYQVLYVAKRSKQKQQEFFFCIVTIYVCIRMKMNGADLQKELNSLKLEYKDKYKELYPRKLNPLRPEDKNKHQIKIMQFNVLADGLSGLYSNSQKDDKAFVGVPQESLEFNYRGFRVIEEIMRHDPDIVTMEEVDQFEHYLKGYTGFHSPKKSSPCLEIGRELNKKMLPDGVATFYKTKNFKLVDSRLFGKQRNENE